MAEINELFHKLGNWHNKISVAAGLTKAELKKKFKDEPVPEEIEQILVRLSFLEKEAIEASRTLNQLKALVYKK